MSVTTLFDEKKQELSNHLTTSIRLLHELLDENLWGHEQMSDEYLTELALMRLEIKKMRDKL